MFNINEIHELQEESISLNEAGTIDKVIKPTLTKLGHPNYTILSEHKMGNCSYPYVDYYDGDAAKYMCYDKDPPRSVDLAIIPQEKHEDIPEKIIEAKRAGTSLYRYHYQILGYLEIAAYYHVEMLGVITDGWGYHFFHNFYDYTIETDSREPIIKTLFFYFRICPKEKGKSDEYKNKLRIFECLLGPENDLNEIQELVMEIERKNLNIHREYHVLDR